MVDGTGDEWHCEGLKSVNDHRGPAGDVAEGVYDNVGGVKAVVPADASVVDAEGGVTDENELVVLPDGGREAGSAGEGRWTAEADTGVAGDMLEAAEDVLEPVGIPKGVAASANALTEAVVGVKAPVVAPGKVCALLITVGMLQEVVNVLLTAVDELPEVAGVTGVHRDPASCPPPPCDDTDVLVVINRIEDPTEYEAKFELWAEGSRLLSSMENRRASLSEVDVRVEGRLRFEYAKLPAKRHVPAGI
ncbi:uncharacterized protein IUM83_03135 [Phytophthora cinnamomi]|uniref:uncharacterized protein n=1 Tax=Phytophthora cinnamomi TaxID=4785 RepID=UPI00355A53E8|nr:hypothetical protein IUM83_03135 [Phytophthora cinnamomi]